MSDKRDETVLAVIYIDYDEDVMLKTFAPAEDWMFFIQDNMLQVRDSKNATAVHVFAPGIWREVYLTTRGEIEAEGRS